MFLSKKAIHILFKKRGGSLMVEAIVALSVIVIGMLGVIGMLTRSLALNKDISQKFVATYLAAEGIEVVKSLIDYNFTSSRAWNTNVSAGDYELSYNSTVLSDYTSLSFLKYDSASSTYSYNGNIITPFKRKVTITELSDGNEIKAVSSVIWLERGASKQIDLEDHFFNWR